MRVPLERIALCFDGTWNTSRSNTNVSRLFRKMANGTSGFAPQVCFYDEGVGTQWGERIRGGLLGMGLDKNIRQGYAWLASELSSSIRDTKDKDGFLQGPDLFLFGFSRGAFTARSLGGLINYLGVPKYSNTPQGGTKTAEDKDFIKQAWKLYTERPTAAQEQSLKDDTATQKLRDRVDAHKKAVEDFRKQNYFPVRIHFIGVWDTVGALGIPRIMDYWWIPSIFRPSSQYIFHDTNLSKCIRYAYHAVAIDEHREPYCVTLWTEKEKEEGSMTKEVEQRWFPGAHSNVGGGYEDDLLPDPPLVWIAQKAAEKGLHFVNDAVIPGPDTREVPPSIPRVPMAFALDGREFLVPVRDSYAEFLGGIYKFFRSLPGASGRAYRRMLVAQDGIEQTVDATAYKKLDTDMSYRPPNLAQAGRADVSFHVATLGTNTTAS